MVSTRWGASTTTGRSIADVPPLPPSRAQRHSACRNEMEQCNGTGALRSSTPLSSQRTTAPQQKTPFSQQKMLQKSRGNSNSQGKKEAVRESTNKYKQSLHRRNSLSVLHDSSNTPSHFLHGIHLDSCDDILALPDPPTPNDRQNGRAALSKTPQFSPLVDISNGSNSKRVADQGSEMNQWSSHLNSSGASRSARTKRSRQSLCHVPAPNPLNHPITTKSTSTSRLEKEMEESEAASRQPSSRKRTKRRTSVLPQPGADDEADVDESLSTADFLTTNSSSLASTVDHRQQTHVMQLPQPRHAPPLDLQEIRKLVCAYTSVPVEERNESQACKEIRRGFGYPIVAPVPLSVDLFQITSPVRTRASKYEIILKLGPNVHRLDDCKTSDSLHAEAITECRVERFGGRLLYFHIPSGKQISPEEYEERYLVMLDEVGKIRSESWKTYFDGLQVQENTFAATKEDSSVSQAQVGVLPSTALNQARVNSDHRILASVNPLSVGALTNVNGDLNTKASATVGIIGDLDARGKPHGAHPAVCGALDGVSISTQTGSEVCALVSDFEQVSKSEVGKNENQGISQSPVDKVEKKPKSSPQVLLPLPSRDEFSADPDIARAEERLWRAIDNALEEYSREVIAIRSKRNAMQPARK